MRIAGIWNLFLFSNKLWATGTFCSFLEYNLQYSYRYLIYIFLNYRFNWSMLSEKFHYFTLCRFYYSNYTNCTTRYPFLVVQIHVSIKAFKVSKIQTVQVRKYWLFYNLRIIKKQILCLLVPQIYSTPSTSTSAYDGHHTQEAQERSCHQSTAVIRSRIKPLAQPSADSPGNINSYKTF